jgi:ribosomal protein S28E/S33
MDDGARKREIERKVKGWVAIADIDRIDPL